MSHQKQYSVPQKDNVIPKNRMEWMRWDWKYNYAIVKCFRVNGISFFFWLVLIASAQPEKKRINELKNHLISCHFCWVRLSWISTCNIFRFLILTSIRKFYLTHFVLSSSIFYLTSPQTAFLFMLTGRRGARSLFNFIKKMSTVSSDFKRKTRRKKNTINNTHNRINYSVR